jgi:hypothetical protein
MPAKVYNGIFLLQGLLQARIGRHVWPTFDYYTEAGSFSILGFSLQCVAMLAP